MTTYLLLNAQWTMNKFFLFFSFFLFFLKFFFLVGEAVCALQLHTFTLLTTYALLLRLRQHRPLERGRGGNRNLKNPFPPL